jgi:copper chaperone NosL
MLSRRAVILLALSQVGCKPDKGPVEINYGRDTCTMCGMIISDPRTAAEIRGGPRHEVMKFDDIGEAVAWSRTQAWMSDPDTEFWAMNSEDGKTWLDARKAFYRHGDTPMNYDFVAVPAAGKDTVNFEEMRTQTLAHDAHAHGHQP